MARRLRDKTAKMSREAQTEMADKLRTVLLESANVSERLAQWAEHPSQVDQLPR